MTHWLIRGEWSIGLALIGAGAGLQWGYAVGLMAVGGLIWAEYMVAGVVGVLRRVGTK